MVRGAIKKILLHNLSLALLLCIPFVFVINHFIDKYKLEISTPINLDFYRYLYFNDLNNDGNSDKIYFGENQLGKVYCKVYDTAHRGQQNTNGNFAEYKINPLFADINEDGNNEIIFLTVQDSFNVFLNIVDYVNEKVEGFRICEVGVPGKRDFGAAFYDFIDLDKNGQKEILFKIDAGFALQPRAIYSFNPYTKEIKRTPQLGSKLNANLIEDLDNDGYKEIICGTFTYQNYDTTANYPYDDNWSRLFVFDHNLKFEFEPLQLSNIRSQAVPCIFVRNDSSFVHVRIDYRGADLMKNKQLLIDADGIIIQEKDFIDGDAVKGYHPRLLKWNDMLVTIDTKGNLLKLDPNLNFHELKKFPDFACQHTLQLDINSDGVEEFVFIDNEMGILTVTDIDFENPVKLSMPGGYIWFENPVVSVRGTNMYLMSNATGSYYLTYSQNVLWNYRFVFYALVFVFFYLLLLITGKVQAYKLQEKTRIERQMQQLQYQAITSRFSPHYTFNVLTSFSTQIYNKDNPELYDYFTKFIRQLRYLYDDKNAITRSLKEEIDFCRDYLDIQKMRFSNKFDYRINIEESVPLTIKVPKMLLHTFVENAFKHGLRPYTEGGIITIKVEHENNTNSIIIEITDNGIGRQAARKYAKEHPELSSGRGLEMLNQLVTLMNKKDKQKIEIETVDLIKSLQPGGTTVRIFISLS